MCISDAFAAVDIRVAPNGDDNNNGTAAEPMATLSMAIRKARELRRLEDESIQGGINIILEEGTYYFYEPLQLRPEDSGTADSPTTIMAEDGVKAVLSGGVTVGGWEKYSGTIKGLPNEAKGKIWVADSPYVGGRQLEFRQMWVDDVKADRASNLTDGILDRILTVDKKNEIQWIPKPKFKFSDLNQVEFVIHQWWAIANLRVRDMQFKGDSCGVSFHQPESKIQFEHPWPAPFIDEKKDMNGNSAFFFANAIELLNKPGEWYHDLKSGKIYYYPHKGENLKNATITVPVLENIVRITGMIDWNVEYVNFKNISFNHASWMRPSLKGHVALQAGFYFHEAYKLTIPGTPDKADLENQAWLGRQEAGVKVRFASNLKFEGCRFEHMAATGLDLVEGTSHNLVEGCLFRDIGGTAINVGFFGNEAFEAHLPFGPKDERIVSRHETIANNRIVDVTNEDWGCVGIGAGYVSDIMIVHNDISDIFYTGISLGWGWTRTVHCMRNNTVANNYIHVFAKQMYDVSGVYTLGMQPNTEVRENRVEDLQDAPYAHDPHHYQYLYLDENSSYIRVLNNYTEKDKFKANANGPGNLWENNGPQVADSIRNVAGLETKYKHILDW